MKIKVDELVKNTLEQVLDYTTDLDRKEVAGLKSVIEELVSVCLCHCECGHAIPYGEDYECECGRINARRHASNEKLTHGATP